MEVIVIFLVTESNTPDLPVGFLTFDIFYHLKIRQGVL